MACIFYFITQNNTFKHNFYNHPEDDQLYYQYLNALFWAFMTISTIKEGEIKILTIDERILAMVCMIIGFCV